MNIGFFLVVFSETVKSDIARTSTFFKGEIIIFFSETETCMRFDFFSAGLFHMSLPHGTVSMVNFHRGQKGDQLGTWYIDGSDRSRR